MAKEIKTIGVLTSGGDAPAMNPAIRAVVRTAQNYGISCLGILRGYNGLINGDNIELDANNRPMMFYGSSVHDQCERREHFDNGEFAPSFDSEEARNGWCLYELGCKGPDTMNNCPKVKFNGTNWPVGAGHPCIGCSEPGFWDKLSPFYEN